VPLAVVRFVAALAALLVPASLVAACGDDGLPGNAVARVDGETIQKTSFEHWVRVAEKAGGKGKTDRKQQREQALQLLINAKWLEGEASDLGIKVSDADVRKVFEQQKKQSFPKEADYRKYLRDSGQTTEDLLFVIRVQTVLTGKIQEKIVKGKDHVSEAQISDYYTKNKQRFAVPERRDLRVVLTKSKAKAEQARQALRSGSSWTSVAKRYSVDQASKSKGGKVPGVTKGSQEKALDEAVFKARKGRLVGPMKTQFGYYVVEVTKVSEPKQQSLAEAKQAIRQQLATQQQQKAMEAFAKDFEKKWKDKTECHERYVTQGCKNAPKPKPSPAATASPKRG
jgi:foldase protein PrsA